MRAKKTLVVDGQRPVSTKGARTATSIVQAGAEILLKEGLLAVNKRRIAGELGISDGNVSYYFPTRDSLLAGVLEYELDEYFRRYHAQFLKGDYSARARFDTYVIRWVDEYQDRFVRVFFSQILTFGETEPLIAHYRDRVYRVFFEQLLGFAKALVPALDPEELQQRVLLVISLLEGLHAVTAFRPETIRTDAGFTDRVLKVVHDIIGDESGA